MEKAFFGIVIHMKPNEFDGSVRNERIKGKDWRS